MPDDDGRYVGANAMKGRPMRRVFCALLIFGTRVPGALVLAAPISGALIFGLLSPACAQDFPILRGSQTVGPATFTRWSGFYFGGQLGLTNGNANFSTSTSGTVSYVLRETALEDEFTPSQWPILGTANNTGPSYGGFFGYNTQWQDVVLGVEANLNYANLSLNAPSTPIGPLKTATDALGDTHTVTMSAAGSLANFNFATLRARGGYVIGNFMPYGFAGIAFGLGSTRITANVSDNQCSTATPPVCNLFNFAGSSGMNNEVLYGFTAGGGVDVALTANFFLRAEVEWDEFNPPPGVLTSIVTGRFGAGFKF